jgi:type III secretion protein J
MIHRWLTVLSLGLGSDLCPSPPPSRAGWPGWLCIACLLAVLSGCGKTVDLQGALNDTDANEIVTLLHRHGIEAKKRITKEGVSLSVRDDDISRATDVMRAAGLPRRNLPGLGQVFKKEGMISTPLEERVRYIYGLSAELEYTLQQFDRVVAARVHVVLPERVAPGEPIQPSSAAVFVKYVPPLDEDMIIPRIRNLVASSIPGLSGEDTRAKVSVILTASDLVAPAVEWTDVGPFRVMGASATALTATLFVLSLFPVALLLGALVFFGKRNPRVAALVSQYVRKMKAGKAAAAGDTAAPGDTAATGATAPGQAP